MKTFLVILLVILVFVVIGFVTFLATFDIDRYRPMLVTKMEEAVGSPVKLDKISLGWQGGVALEMKKLSIYRERAGFGRPAIQLDKASAVVKLEPLLKKNIEISSVILQKPKITITKNASGRVRVEGFNPPSKAVTEKPKADTASNGAGGDFKMGALLIGLVKIENGEIFYDDQSRQEPVKFVVRDIDVILRNVSLDQPIEFAAGAALFAEKQNFQANGRFRPPVGGQPAVLDGLALEANLDGVRVTDLMDSFPELRAFNPRESLAGALLVDIDRLELSPQGTSSLEARVRFRDGFLPVSGIRTPIEKVNMEAIARKDKIDLTSFNAGFSGAVLAASGAVDHYTLQPKTTLRATLDDLQLDMLFEAMSPESPQIQGKMSLTFEGAAIGKSVPQVRQTALGQGRLVLKDGVLRNVNILRQVFSKISMIPGLMNTLESRLPPNYKERLDAKDTYFLPLELPASINNGAIFMNSIRIATDDLEMSGAGRVGLDGALNMQMIARIDPELSKALIASVAELEFLLDPQGRLEIPVRIDGTVQHVIVLPDLQYVASRLAVTKAQDLIGNFLEKSLQKKASGDAAAAPVQ